MELYFPKILLLVRSYNFPMAAIGGSNAFYDSCLSKFLICFSTPRDDISISILTFSDEGLPNKLTFSKKNILL